MVFRCSARLFGVSINATLQTRTVDYLKCRLLSQHNEFNYVR